MKLLTRLSPWLREISPYLALLARRGKLLAFMNLAFFGGVFVVALTSDLLLPPNLYSGLTVLFPDSPYIGEFYVMVFGIFVLSLIWNCFLYITLPGFMFFPLSTALLLFRAFTWGIFLRTLPTGAFLIVIPNVVLEGEAYALAAAAGTIVGIAWLKPKWIFRPEKLTRIQAFEKAFIEWTVLYAFLLFLLIVAASVETTILRTIFH